MDESRNCPLPLGYHPPDIHTNKKSLFLKEINLKH